MGRLGCQSPAALGGTSIRASTRFAFSWQVVRKGIVRIGSMNMSGDHLVSVTRHRQEVVQEGQMAIHWMI